MGVPGGGPSGDGGSGSGAEGRGDPGSTGVRGRGSAALCEEGAPEDPPSGRPSSDLLLEALHNGLTAGGSGRGGVL